MSWSSDLENMEAVMAVYDTLGGQNEPRLADLVTPYRRIVRVCDIAVKEAPFSASKKIIHRLFVFKDLLILARYSVQRLATSLALGGSSSNSATNGSSAPKRLTVVGQIRARFSFRRSSKPAAEIASAASAISSGDESTTTSSGSSSKAALIDSSKGKIVLAYYIPMSQCTCRTIKHNDDDGFFGIQLTHVERIPSPNDPTQIATKVEKLELWHENREYRDALSAELDELMNSIREAEDIKKKESMADTSANGGEPGKSGERKWASRTIKGRHKSLKAGESLSNRMDSVGSESATNSSQFDGVTTGLSLADLEARYNVHFGDTNQGKQEFSVEFPEGPMGFSLSSGEGVGVIVAKLAAESFAEVGGVCIGDRIIQIGDTKLNASTSWQEAVAILKSRGRPLSVTFERNPDINSKVEEAQRDEAVKDPNSKRRWNTKKVNRAKSMTSLNDLENMYSQDAAKDENRNQLENTVSELFNTMAQNATSDEEKQCINVLRELLSTERDYVASLRLLVGDYIIPLRRATSRICCKDDMEGSRICEHGLLRSTCVRESKATRPLCKGEDVKDIFMNTETLMKVNSELLFALHKGISDLSKKTKSPSITSVVENIIPSFVKVLPFFNMYALYCHQYPVATSKLKQIRAERKDLDDFLAKKETGNEKPLMLTSLLIKPVQRICKYPLLFTELLKSVRNLIEKWRSTGEIARVTKDLSTVLESLEMANVQVQKIADDVNEKVQVQEAINSVVDIFEELGAGKDGNLDILFAPSRRYLGAQELFMKPAHSKDPEPSHYKLYIFNDMLMFATLKSKGIGSNGTLSMRRSSRKKSITSGSFDPSSSSASSSQNDGMRWTKSVVIDLRQCDLKMSNTKDKNDWSSFLIKHVERNTVEEKGVSRIVTEIHKYEVFMPMEEECLELYRKIMEKIETLQQQREGDEKGREMYGSAELNKKRSWKKRSTNHMSARFSHGNESETESQGSNHAAALNDLAARYVQ